MFRNWTNARARKPLLVAWLLGGLVVVAATASVTAADKKPAKAAKIDAKALAMMVQHFDKVEKHEYPWGWIRWLMSSKHDPKAEMTFGIVRLNAGEMNPMHIHPNCE